MSEMRENLAQQAANTYKGKVCCYANVTKRDAKTYDGTLEFSKTSTVGLNIFDPDSKTGVKFFLTGTTPSYIYEKTLNCMKFAFEQSMKQQDVAPRSAAYTVKLKKGEFKDRTPAEILGNDMRKYDALIQYYNELIKNINNPQYGKYRRMNEEQANAIREGCTLASAGQLVKAPSYPKIKIWEGTKTPDNKKLDKDGYTEVRLMELVFDTDPCNAEPYSMKITNCMAPPVNGSQVGARLSQAKNKAMLIMNFTEEIWYGFWKDVVDARGAFARLVESDRIVASEKSAWKPQNINKQSSVYNNAPAGYYNYPYGYSGYGYD